MRVRACQFQLLQWTTWYATPRHLFGALAFIWDRTFIYMIPPCPRCLSGQMRLFGGGVRTEKYSTAIIMLCARKVQPWSTSELIKAARPPTDNTKGVEEIVPPRGEWRGTAGWGEPYPRAFSLSSQVHCVSSKPLNPAMVWTFIPTISGSRFCIRVAKGFLV